MHTTQMCPLCLHIHHCNQVTVSSACNCLPCCRWHRRSGVRLKAVLHGCSADAAMRAVTATCNASARPDTCSQAGAAQPDAQAMRCNLEADILSKIDTLADKYAYGQLARAFAR